MYDIKNSNIEQFLNILNGNNNDMDIIHNILLKTKNVLFENINV